MKINLLILFHLECQINQQHSRTTSIRTVSEYEELPFKSDQPKYWSKAIAFDSKVSSQIVEWISFEASYSFGGTGGI